MDTALDPKESDSRHVLAARADKELAHAYEQITRADEQISHAQKQLSKLEREAAAANRTLFDRPAVRGLTGLVLAACIGVTAIAWQSSYRDAAKQFAARLTPQRVATSSLPLESPEPAAPQISPGVQLAAAEPTPPQPAPPARTEPETIAPAVAALSPESMQLLQSMARDLATVGQGIEQLKASQAQIARDNASIAAQLRASQEQIAHVVAKVSDQSLRPRIPSPPPRPAATTATPARKPAPNASLGQR